MAFLPDGDTKADREGRVVEVDGELRQMQADPVELGPPGLGVQHLGILLLAPPAFPCPTQTPRGHSSRILHCHWPCTRKHFWMFLLTPSTFTCYTHTHQGTSLPTVYFHLPHANLRSICSCTAQRRMRRTGRGGRGGGREENSEGIDNVANGGYGWG